MTGSTQTIESDINKRAKVSAVILTHNRPKDLWECVSSLISQTLPPREIVVVDNSTNDRSSATVLELEKMARLNGIEFKSIRGEDPFSVPKGRNVGLKAAKYEYVLICDDDVVFDTHYVETMIMSFDRHPSLIGLQGSTPIQVEPKSLKKSVHRALCRVFYLSRPDDNQKLLPSGYVTMCQASNTGPTVAEWLISNNMVFRADKIRGFRFDNNLVRMADVDFTYHVHLAYPGRLALIRDARIMDKHGSMRTWSNRAVVGSIVSSAYLFFKYKRGSPKSAYYFTFSRLGVFLTHGLAPLLIHGDYRQFISCTRGLIYTFVHLKELANGEPGCVIRSVSRNRS
jgi:GT2 family glycosyltransferase